MEHAIGEIVTLPDGRKTEVVESEEDLDLCKGCIWDGVKCWGVFYEGIRGFCGTINRTDHKNIIYKEIK